MVVTCAVLLVAQCAWWRGSEGWVSGDTVAECTHFVAAEVPERQHVIMLGSFVPALQLPVGRVCVCMCMSIICTVRGVEYRPSHSHTRYSTYMYIHMYSM